MSNGKDGVSADNPLFGYKAKAGDFDVRRTRSGDLSGIDEYLRTGYGDFILNLADNDSSKAERFMDYLYKSKDKEAGYMRNMVWDETSDGTSYKDERNRTGENSVGYWVEKIYEIFDKLDREGLNIN